MAGTNIGASEDSVEKSEWVRAHEALSRLARERAAADAEEGRWLLAALRSAAHVHLGYGSFGEYVERLFGYKPRSTQEKLRVAEALEELSAVAQALESGVLTWSAVRELTRVAVAETQLDWLAAARGKTVHQLEALVTGKSPGDGPSSASQPEARRHVLRFEVAPETLALFREAMNKLRRGGTPFDDDTALMQMARHVLAGAERPRERSEYQGDCPARGKGAGTPPNKTPTDEGRASYQIALSVCSECGRGCQLANGELVPVGAEVVAMAACDGQHLGPLPTPVPHEGAVASDSPHANEGAHVGAKRPRERSEYQGDCPAASTARASEASTRGTAPQGARGMGHPPTKSKGAGTPPKKDARAKQTVPPATRRAVLRRDHRRCTVPGCRNTLFLDVHHLELRSEGGRNEADNLITLCGAHHRAAHRGERAIGLFEELGPTSLHHRRSDTRSIFLTRRREGQEELGFGINQPHQQQSFPTFRLPVPNLLGAG